MRTAWRERASWCMFDFANSAFVTIMITAFYGRFFTDSIAKNSSAPATLWGAAIAVSMAVVAISSPLLGAVVDRTASKLTFLRGYALVNVLACIGLGFVTPENAYAIPLSLGLLAIANVAFEGGYVFYNAFLPELAPPDRVGRLSGYGWAVGYAGGLGCLIVVKLGGWIPEQFDNDGVQRAQFVPIAVGLWFALFSLPMLLFVRDRSTPKAGGSVIGSALDDVKQSLRLIRSSKDLLRFFLAYLMFTDALETVIVFTGKFTGDALGFTPSDTVNLFLVLNIVAAPGAILFGYLVDRIGSIRGVALSVVLWIGVVIGSMLVQTKGQFWPIAVMAAIGLGATQSTSRTVIVRLVPKPHVARVFGMMTVVGRASAIVGPVVYGVVTDTTHSARLAIGTVGIFLVGGLLLLGGIDEGRAVKWAKQQEASFQ